MSRHDFPHSPLQDSPPMLNAKQCLEREAECRHMCTLASLTHVRRAELELMADSWARLAVLAEPQ